jgi:hypothetical protein
MQNPVDIVLTVGGQRKKSVLRMNIVKNTFQEPVKDLDV